jgi:hypothetical protein
LLIVISTGSDACAKRLADKAIKANNVITDGFIKILNDKKISVEYKEN